MIFKRQSIFALTLVLIPSKEQFEKIAPDKQKKKKNLCQIQKPANDDELKQIPPDQENQQEKIIIPKCGKIPNPQQFIPTHPSSRPNVHTLGYIRLKIMHNLPNPFIYELTEQDHTVLNYMKQKYTFPKDTNFEIQQRHMALIFRMCEDFSHSKDTQVLRILNEENLMSQHISSSLGQQFAQTEREMLSGLICEIFQYWKIVKKDNLDQPLIRKYWPNNNVLGQPSDIWLPYKSRSPGILEPVYINNELKAISVKQLPQQSHEMRIISSMDEGKVLLNTQRRKRKQSLKMMRNFHYLAENYGFGSSLSAKGGEKSTTRDPQKLFEKKNQSTSTSNQNLLNESQISKNRLIHTSPNSMRKAPQFRSITEWIRDQKKLLRKQKRQLETNSSWQQSQQLSQTIEIPEEYDDEISIVDNSEFYNLTLIKVEKNLEEQEVFTFNVKEENRLTEDDYSNLGSENFYSYLDFDIIEPENLFSKKSLNAKVKTRFVYKNQESDQSCQSDTTVYEKSQQISNRKARPYRKRKQIPNSKSKSKKKVKRK